MVLDALEGLNGSGPRRLGYGTMRDLLIGLTVMGADGTLTRHYRPAPFSWRRYLYTGDYVPTPTIIFRRELLRTTALLDETFQDAADYDFYLRLFHGRP